MQRISVFAMGYFWQAGQGHARTTIQAVLSHLKMDQIRHPGTERPARYASGLF
ncbi:MAG: hypothetical protein KUG58_01400 [Marinosulfonomonas sp.]|nr:hypothetical protein [Marinosulfonomonas sp.]